MNIRRESFSTMLFVIRIVNSCTLFNIPAKHHRSSQLHLCQRGWGGEGVPSNPRRTASLEKLARKAVKLAKTFVLVARWSSEYWIRVQPRRVYPSIERLCLHGAEDGRGSANAREADSRSGHAGQSPRSLTPRETDLATEAARLLLSRARLPRFSPKARSGRDPCASPWLPRSPDWDDRPAYPATNQDMQVVVTWRQSRRSLRTL